MIVGEDKENGGNKPENTLTENIYEKEEAPGSKQHDRHPCPANGREWLTSRATMMSSSGVRYWESMRMRRAISKSCFLPATTIKAAGISLMQAFRSLIVITVIRTAHRQPIQQPWHEQYPLSHQEGKTGGQGERKDFQNLGRTGIARYDVWSWKQYALKFIFYLFERYITSM